VNIIERLGALPAHERNVVMQRLRNSVNGYNGELKFSVFFFSDLAQGEELYDLLFACAEFADTHGFESIWVPERHFHPFGGSYPNPAVLAAAIAVRTERVRICAGSVLAPLHHPLRMAEEWSVVDNLSHGRVGMALASGWQSQDFVLNPSVFEPRRAVTLERVEQLRTLWAGKPLAFNSPEGKPLSLTTFPRPTSAAPALWLTAASNPETWLAAARADCGVLTGLMEQNIDQLTERIALYRTERAAFGLDPDAGRVTVMVHTFVGEDEEHARSISKPALTEYLTHHMSLYTLSLIANRTADVENVSEEDKAELVELGFQRYFSDAAMLGDAEKVEHVARRLHAIGVNEIAALVNFGIEKSDVLEGLSRLDAVRRRIASSNK
jgi:natural product biosynthesis luciferase-like monooxygenase protein